MTFAFSTYEECGFGTLQIKYQLIEKRIGSNEVWDKSEKALCAS